MIAQGSGGKIVNTGSIASRQGYWDFVPYCVASSATLAITQAPPEAVIEHGNPLTPLLRASRYPRMWTGSTRTSEPSTPPGELSPMRDIAAGTLIGRPGSQSWRRFWSTSLAESDYMTGQMYMVDGGQVLV